MSSQHIRQYSIIVPIREARYTGLRAECDGESVDDVRSMTTISSADASGDAVTSPTTCSGEDEDSSWTSSEALEVAVEPASFSRVYELRVRILRRRTPEYRLLLLAIDARCSWHHKEQDGEENQSLYNGCRQ